MGRIFNRNHRFSVEMRGKEKDSNSKGTVSTVLVPEELSEIVYSCFPANRSGNADIRQGLRGLLEKYRGLFAIGYLPFSNKAKLKFQDSGLNLQEMKFRPFEEDWAELGIIAYGLGVSRCWLFSYFLELERSFIGQLFSNSGIRDVLATASASRPEQTVRISGRRRILQRILHFRI